MTMEIDRRKAKLYDNRSLCAVLERARLPLLLFLVLFFLVLVLVFVFLILSDRITAHELVEVAALAARRSLLVKKRQLVPVEGLEELVPSDRLQGFLTGVPRKVETKQTCVAAPCSFDTSRVSAPFLGPLLNLIVVRGHLRGAGARRRRAAR